MLAGEGGAWAGKRDWSMTRHWRLNCFSAFTMSVLWCFCLALGAEKLSSSSKSQSGLQGPTGPFSPNPA